jgi:lipoprotein-anchoring transpeptidase ErfK/SrfK
MYRSGHSVLVAGNFARITEVSRVEMRFGPNYDCAPVVDVPRGAIVRVLSGPYYGNWYLLKYRGRTGYAVSTWLVAAPLIGRRIAQRGRQSGIVVSVARQQLEAYQDGNLFLVTAVTTGRPELPTPTGVTYVSALYSPFLMSSPWPPGNPYYFADIPMQYAIQFRDLYYLHHAPRRHFFGYGTQSVHRDPDGNKRQGSHGCVNMPLWAVRRLYFWVQIGTKVHVLDDSDSK